MPPTVLPSGDQIELRHRDQHAVVVEVGGALRSYEAGGRALLDGYAADEMCPSARGQSLIPWPNRLRDGAYAFDGESLQLPLTEPAGHNAIHGLVRWESWTVGERAEEDRVRMEHVLHPRDGYPFTLALAIEYALGDGGLTVRTTATNAGDRRAPYGAGAHPYLTAGTPVVDPCELRAPGAVRMLTDDRGIPVGEEPVDGTPYDFREARAVGDLELDTGFAQLHRDADGLARVRLAAPGGGEAVTLWQDAGYAYLMLFTGDSLPDESRRRGGLGVEPMTCAPNAFAGGDGLRVLEPGEAFAATWGITPG